MKKPDFADIARGGRRESDDDHADDDHQSERSSKTRASGNSDEAETEAQCWSGVAHAGARRLGRNRETQAEHGLGSERNHARICRGKC